MSEGEPALKCLLMPGPSQYWGDHLLLTDPLFHLLYFNLDTNIFPLNPLFNNVPFDSEVISILKKTILRASRA